MEINEEMNSKKDVEMLNNSKKREDLVPGIDDVIEFFTGLKKKLEDCNLNDIPEEIVINANSSLDWLIELLFFSSPDVLQDLFVLGSFLDGLERSHRRSS